ncbi:MAG: hypothetical protein ABI456_07055 [Ktedonobacteraceae bacterium]
MNAPILSDQPLLPGEEILHLSLPGILPAGEILAIFTPDGVVVRLAAPKREGQPPRLLGAQLFTVDASRQRLVIRPTATTSAQQEDQHEAERGPSR